MKSAQRPGQMQVALGLAFAAASTIARVASAETQLPHPPPWSDVPRPLNIELAVPQGMVLNLRPATEEGVPEPNLVLCPPSCRLAVYAGRYRLTAEPPPESGLRRVAKTVEILSDARIAVAPGSRSDHQWGVGLTVAGGIVLGLGLAFFALTYKDDNTATNVATFGMMGIGAPATAGGIYLLVRSRGKVTIEETWPRSMVPLPPASESRVDVGWRF